MDLHQRNHPQIVAGIGVGYCEKLISYRNRNISKTAEDRAKEFRRKLLTLETVVFYFCLLYGRPICAYNMTRAQITD